MTPQEIQAIKQRFKIIGTNAQLNRAIDVAVQVAPTDMSVLVTGESGVGKEHFPQIIHAYSARKHGPYFAINCGAIPEGTIDSELFGHEKGAFTDARSERKGYFEIADGGTLFLDEVGELPLQTQVRLLRVLETGEFIRMGSSQVLKTNVRVVAATNLDIPRAIREGKFRADLYYRLNSVMIQVPALRDRKEDIPLLFRKFATDFAEKYRMPAIRLNEEATHTLQAYYWQGNIRQLKNVAEQISIMERNHDITADTLRRYLPAHETERGVAVIGSNNNSESTYLKEREMLLQAIYDLKREVNHLKQQMENGQAYTTMSPTNELPAANNNYTTPDTTPNEDEWQMAEEVVETDKQESKSKLPTMQELERERIIMALENNHGNRKAAAAEVNMSERTLYRKIKEFGL